MESLGSDDEPLTRDAFLREALGSELLSEPGTTYLYSNVGYSLLAAVIEEVSGQGYEAYLAEHLFEPAGMTRTGYVLPDWSESQVAVEYDADGRAQGTPLDHPWADDGPYWNLRGNGWSYGEIARDPAGDAFVFWVANRSAGDGWDLGESGGDVTSALFERLEGGR